MLERDLVNLIGKDKLKEGIENRCANCYVQLRYFETIMPCCHYLCQTCSAAPQVGCMICDLLASLLQP